MTEEIKLNGTKSMVERGLTKLVIPYKGNVAYFVEGSDNYRNVFTRILERDLRPATGEEMADLLYAVYCDKEFTNRPESKEIKKIMRDSRSWVANINLFTDKGVYVVYDEKVAGLNEKLQINELEEILKTTKEINGVRFSENGKVRFAPRDTYKGRGRSPEEFAKNGFIIASYGLEGANKLKEVAKEFNYNPEVWILDTVNPVQRVSSLYNYYGGRLDADGNNFDYKTNGYAFGLLK